MGVGITTFGDAALLFATIAAHALFLTGIIITAKTLLAVIEVIIHAFLVGHIAAIAFHAVA
jgi:hypothetical protein